MPHLTRQDCRSTRFSAPRFLNQTASRWLGCAAIALLLLAGGRQNAEADLIINFQDNGSGGVAGSFNGTLTGLPTTGAFDTGANYVNNSAAGLLFYSLPTFATRADLKDFTRDPGNLALPATDFGDLYGASINPNPIIADSNGYLIILESSTTRIRVADGTNAGGSGASKDGIVSFDNQTFDFAAWNWSAAPDVGTSYSWGNFGGAVGDGIQVNFVGVPEPTTALALLGLVTSAFFRRRRRVMA